MTTRFIIGRYYSRIEIAAKVKGALQWYLPTYNREIVAICLRKSHNPKAPNVVFCGFGKRIEKTGEWLSRETRSLPVFVKEESNRWKYYGLFKVKSSCTKGPAFKREVAGSKNPASISRVVFLERAR
jgi:hypothetical protein